MDKVKKILSLMTLASFTIYIICIVLLSIFPDWFNLVSVAICTFLFMLPCALILEVTSSKADIQRPIKTSNSANVQTYNRTTDGFLSGFFSYVTQEEYSQEYQDYLHNHATGLKLFERPNSNDKKIILANKYVVLSFEINLLKSGMGFISILDKLSWKEEYLCLNFSKTRYALSQAEQLFEFFKHICNKFDYEIKADDIENFMEEEKIGFYEFKAAKKIKPYLNINEMSEAELTALPGVTIAKAKHAIKIKKQQTKFLTMNQFYKAINLEEEFIKQIPLRGNKIAYNRLPEFLMLEMKRQEEK